jgi:hypothetical protein
MSDAETEIPESPAAPGPDVEDAAAAPGGDGGAPPEPPTSPAHERDRRRRRIPLRTHRIRTAGVAAVIVLVAVALPFLIVKATRTVANSKAGKTVTPTGPAVAELPGTPAALLVVVGPDHQVAGLVVLAVDASGKGGTAVVVPAGMDLPGAAGAPPSRLGDAYSTGGLDGQRQAVESALGITTSSATEVDEAELAALLAPYAPLKVTLDDRAVDTGTNGKETVLYPAGPVDLTAGDAAHLLVAKGPSESEVARLARTTAIWDAVVKHGAPGPSASTTVAPPSSAAAASTTVRSAPSTTGGSAPSTTVRSAPSTTARSAISTTRASRSGRTTTSLAPATTATLVPPTTSPGTVAWAARLAAVEGGPARAAGLAAHPVLDAVGNPNGVDLLAVDNAAMRLLLAETMPGAISPANDNIRLRLINNSGDPNLLAAAAQRLVDAGANLIIVSAPTATARATTIEYQDSTEQGPATTFQPVVGATVVRASQDRVDGIDATVIVGSDFGAFLQTEQATTTTTISPTTSSNP